MIAKGQVRRSSYDDSRGKCGGRRTINSAEGAEYDSQGQVRSVAEHVAPGSITKNATQP